MSHHAKRKVGVDYMRLGITACAIFAAAYLLLGNATTHSSLSAEARFTDETDSGLALVPASGATETSYVDTYTPITGSYTPITGSYESSYPCGSIGTKACPTVTGSYTPITGSYTPITGSYPVTGSYSPTGVTGSYPPATGSYPPATGSYTSSCWDGSSPDASGNCPACPEGYSPQDNTCIPPAGPTFVGFPTTQGFNASGHLEARPSLVRSGDRSRLYWGVTNVRDCTVRGTNGDGAEGSVTGEWNMLTSGASGQQTGPITSRTDYTLFCRSLVGATPSTITETRTVTVLPSWFEPQGAN